MPDDKAQICWLNGSYYHRRDIINQIKKSITDYDLCIYDEDYSAEYIEMQISSDDMFGKNKVVILNGIPHFKGTTDKSNKKWCEAFNKIPDSCIVIVNNVEIKSRQTIFNHVKKIGKTFNPPEFLKKPEACGYVSDRFEEYEKVVEPESIKLLVDSIGVGQNGVNVDRLLLNVKNVCGFVGKRKKIIEPTDIMKCLSQNTDYVLWDLFGAIDERSFIKCEVLLQRLCSDSTSVKSAIEGVLIPLLWRFKLLMMLKEIKVNGLHDNEIVEKIKQFSKVNKTKSGYHVSFVAELDADNNKKPIYTDYVINTALKGSYGKKPTIDTFTRTELVKAVKIIEECMIKVRMSKSETEALLALDGFFHFICNSDDIKESDLNCLIGVTHE